MADKTATINGQFIINNLLIYKKIPVIMSKIEPIAKDRTNTMQGYKFRGIDDIYMALNPILAEEKVFATSEIIDQKREERQTQKGGTLIYTILTMKFRFYAEDGSFIESVTVGEAMDTGDKSCNKAMSTAYKYAMLQLFCIPTEEPKDTENDTYEVSKISKFQVWKMNIMKYKTTELLNTAEELLQNDKTFTSDEKIALQSEIENRRNVLESWLDNQN